MGENTGYVILQQLSQIRDVKLVQLTSNGMICVRKVLDIFNAEIYKRIVDKPVEGIPYIFGLQQEADKLVVYEEFIPGRTLDEILNEQGPAPEEWAKGILLQLCDAVKQLHSFSPAIIHRDIKPSNVIITPEHRAVLIDLNAAQFADPERNRDTVLMGTQGYAAPEQYGFQRSDVQADIYALGVLLNVMLLGKLPSEELTGGNCASIVECCVQPDPKQRYRSVDKMEQEIQRIGKPAQVFRRFLPPGFRSGNPLHMIVALFFDAVFVWLLIMVIRDSREGLSPYNIGILFFAAFAYLAVVAIATDYLGIHKLLRIDRIRPMWIKLPVITLICILVFLLILGLDNLYAWRFGS